MALILSVFFGLALPWFKHRTFPLWPWPVAGALTMLALVVPGWLGPFYRAWMKLGSVLGALNSKVILSIAYFLVVVPSGFLMRLAGKDPMARKLDKSKVSYRVTRSAENDPYVSMMDKPY